MGPVSMGLDLGQKLDPTALAVVEQERREREGQPGRYEIHFLVRYLFRLPLGTSYPAVADRIVEVADRLAKAPRRDGERAPRPVLFLDATGLGTPVFDILKAAHPRAVLIPCTFTHGDRRTPEQSPHPAGGLLASVKIGKAWLVSRLQVLLQDKRLHLPNTEEARVLAKELQDYQIKVDQDANDKYGAFKVGTHDDLVTALGLACQVDAQVARGWGKREVSGLHA